VKKTFLLIIGLVALLVTASSAQAVPYADWQVSHSYMADNVVSIGAGDPSSPSWETLVQAYSWNSSGSVDISGGSQYLSAGNQWYLKVSDNVGWDSGWIVNFQVRPGDGNTYISTDHPSIWDGHTSYAYVQVPGQVNPTVPEPASMMLLGSGLMGLIGLRRKQS